MKNQNFMLAKLQSGESKPFDGLATGTFVDMYGRKLTIKPEELADYVANTKAVLATAKTESGELIGLPIDMMGHNEGDGAGWITDIELDQDRNVVRFHPVWTEAGKSLISGNVRRYFSPTIITQKKIILGGSLTNWPASRDDKTLEYLLKPIELSSGPSEEMFSIANNLIGGSLNDLIREVEHAFYDLYSWMDYYVYDVFSDHVVALDAESKFWEIDYSKDADGVYEFASESEWREVVVTYKEASMKKKNKGSLTEFFKKMMGGPGSNPVTQEKEGVESMGAKDIDITKLSTEERDGLLDQIIADPALLESKKLAGKIDEIATRKADEKISKAARADRIQQMSKKMTGADGKTEKGLPLNHEQLVEFLSSLDDDQLNKAEALFGSILENGVVGFEELGHSNTASKGTKKLPTVLAGALNYWLEQGKTIDEFFAVNGEELGERADYNLAGFTEKKE